MRFIFTEFDTVLVFLRLALALLLGSLVGVERTLAHKKAGLRTFGIVSLGSALFTLAAMLAPRIFGGGTSEVMRVVAGIVTGVGFLGTGVIIFKDSSLSGGLTTAAGLWVASGIGVAAALGLYGLALSAAILTLLAFTVLWRVEDRVKNAAERNHTDGAKET